MNRLEELLATNAFLMLDGAMGTMLFDSGLPSGHPPEEWNISNPEAIAAVHRAYVEAGTNIILTNSFGGTAYRLKLHQLQDRVYALNKAAAEIGRSVADSADHPVLVAGSLGPTGELLQPMGNMSYADCVAAFADQAKGLADGGADLIWIETMSDLDEVRAAIEGSRSVCDLPVCATMSFDTAGRTMMGVTGERMATVLGPLQLAAMGANCGNNLHDTEAVLNAMHATNPELVLIAKANAGMPEWRGADLVYSGSPEIMGGYAHRVHQHGARLIGGCCGSNPSHIAYMRRVLTGELPVPDERMAGGVSKSAEPAQGSEGRERRRKRKNDGE